MTRDLAVVTADFTVALKASEAAKDRERGLQLASIALTALASNAAAAYVEYYWSDDSESYGEIRFLNLLDARGGNCGSSDEDEDLDDAMTQAMLYLTKDDIDAFTMHMQEPGKTFEGIAAPWDLISVKAMLDADPGPAPALVQILHVRNPDSNCSLEPFVNGERADFGVISVEDIDPGGFTWPLEDWEERIAMNREALDTAFRRAVIEALELHTEDATS